MADAPKNKGGRPRKGDRTVDVTFKLYREQADFLTELGERIGWGVGINEVCQSLIRAEVTALQKQSLQSRPGDLPPVG